MYIDDTIPAGKDETRMNEVRQYMSLIYEIKDMGKPGYFLWMSIVQNQKKKETCMDRATCVHEKIPSKKWEVAVACNSVETVVVPGSYMYLMKATKE